MLIQLSHDEKLSRILSSAITVCFLAVAVDIGMPYEFSLIPPILSCCALAYYILLKSTLPLIVFALVAFAFIVAFFSLINIDVIKQAFFFFMVAFGALCQKHCSKEDLTRSVLTILAIYISIGIFELLIPNVSTLKSLILTRSTMPEGTRGVASLAQEPSFFALVVFSSWIILMTSENFSLRKVDLIAFLAVLALMLTKSGMSILVFPMIFIAFKQSIISFSLFTSTLLLLLFSQLTRAKIFLELLINLNYSVLDESQSGRLFYIIKDLNTIAARYFVPYWPGSY
ncbi:hypothetical protein N9L89_06985, partial [Gammaproteobacteria bacterium]|nr:hypothetical protein [Gammaproteobacteria bacterium]